MGRGRWVVWKTADSLTTYSSGQVRLQKNSQALLRSQNDLISDRQSWGAPGKGVVGSDGQFSCPLSLQMSHEAPTTTAVQPAFTLSGSVHASPTHIDIGPWGDEGGRIGLWGRQKVSPTLKVISAGLIITPT